MSYPNVIAIDGPAASGKSTVGRMLAERLGYLYLDTGCMYRAVTLAALAAGVVLEDEAAVAAIALASQIEVLPAAAEEDGRHYTTLLDGRDVTWQIRTPAVDAHVSLISSYASVRQELVRRQRVFGRLGNVVMVGRDIGSVVMPDASIKLFVTASAEERARRRWQDRRQQGHEEPYEAILADVIRRDAIDGSRLHSPLRRATDAIVIDTSDFSPEEIVAAIIELIEERYRNRSELGSNLP